MGYLDFGSATKFWCEQRGIGGQDSGASDWAARDPAAKRRGEERIGQRAERHSEEGPRGGGFDCTGGEGDENEWGKVMVMFIFFLSTAFPSSSCQRNIFFAALALSHTMPV